MIGKKPNGYYIKVSILPHRERLLINRLDEFKQHAVRRRGMNESDETPFRPDTRGLVD
jgi:hypothetical protein